MATKAKKSASAKKGGKAGKTTKPVKASPAKKNTKKAKPAATRSKAAKKPAAKTSNTKKVAVKPASSKSKAAKPAKAKTITSKKTASASAKVAKPKTVAKSSGKSAAPKLATVKNDNVLSVITNKPTSKSSAGTTGKKKKAKKDKELSDLMLEDILPYQEEFGEEYMNKKQQDHFRAILLQRKKEFMDEMERTVHHLQDEAANFPDPNDRATQEEEFGLVLRTRDRELKYIKNIEDALQRIDEGEYGYCEACGVEIGVRRLEARPTATLCIDCKTLDEIREKQMGG